ncbi:hypothetical protein R8Z50_19070 [Longispora sp. K20-0274]
MVQGEHADGVSNVPARDRAIYARIRRASAAWYKAIHADIADMKTDPN